MNIPCYGLDVECIRRVFRGIVMLYNCDILFMWKYSISPFTRYIAWQTGIVGTAKPKKYEHLSRIVVFRRGLARVDFIHILPGNFTGAVTIVKWSNLGIYSLKEWTFYRKISWNLEAMGFRFRLFQSLWNLTGTSAAVLSRCLWNFRPIQSL